MSLQTGKEENLGGLYQEIIVEHSRHPRRKGRTPQCLYCQEGKNPLCGDEVNVFLAVDKNSEGKPARVTAHFEGKGCSISQASASMMCAAVDNVTVPDAFRLIDKAEDIYSGAVIPSSVEDPEEDLEALSGVAKFPVRIKCAALAWKALEMLLASHFNENGEPRAVVELAGAKSSQPVRKLKIVSTDG